MRKLTSLLLLASLTAGAHATPDPKSRSIDQFAGRLHSEVGKTKGNLVYSPMSIGIALAMTREGATGETAAQMDAVLGKGTGADAKALGKSMKSSPKADKHAPMAPELAVANRLFLDKSMPLVKRFVDITRDDYGAPIESVDYIGDREAARLKINKWVEDQTKNRIKDLIPKGILTNLTRLVLVNAIYLKAQWETPFAPSLTKPRDFAVAGAATKQVPTMRGVIDGASWGAYAGGRVLDLPYHSAPNGPRLGMMIVVPDGKNLDAIEATYAKEGLTGFMKSVKNHGNVDVAMPKFKIGSEFKLNDPLIKLGMPRAFTEGAAQFDGMSTAQRLYIAHVLHKAWIEVDEKGTEAAAATAVVMATEGAVAGKPHEFKVDRSFAFFIHDQHGTVLFGGRVIDPAR